MDTTEWLNNKNACPCYRKKESENHSVVSDCLRPHGLYSPWNSPGQNTRVGSLSLLLGIFPTQGSNPGLPYCRQILYQLTTREAQEYWNGSLSLLQRIFPTQELNLGLLHCRRILYQLSYQGRHVSNRFSLLSSQLKIIFLGRTSLIILYSLALPSLLPA